MIQPKDIVAVQKIIKKAAGDNARDQLNPGAHNIDLKVRITGTIKVGEDYETTPTVSIPVKEVIAAFIVHCGMDSSARLIAMLVEALTPSIEENGKGQGAIKAAIPLAEAAMEEVQKQLLAILPKDYRRGAVTTQLNMQEIEEIEPALV